MNTVGCALAVVVLNYENAADTAACVGSLLSNGMPAGSKVIVVDNGSGAQCVSSLLAGLGALAPFALLETELSTAPDHVRTCIFLHPENAGYAGGNNIGIRIAMRWGANSVLVINNDTIMWPGSLKALIDHCAECPELGVVGAMMSSYDDASMNVEPGLRTLNVVTSASRSEICSTASANRVGLRLPYVSGACMLFSTQALRQVGVFNESFFLFFEEVEICLRLLDSGYQLDLCPGAIVGHRVGATTGASAKGRSHSTRAFFHSSRSAVIFYRIRYPILVPWIVMVRMLFALRLLAEDPKFTMAVLRGLAKGLRAPVECSGQVTDPT